MLGEAGTATPTSATCFHDASANYQRTLNSAICSGRRYALTPLKWLFVNGPATWTASSASTALLHAAKLILYRAGFEGFREPVFIATGFIRSIRYQQKLPACHLAHLLNHLPLMRRPIYHHSHPDTHWAPGATFLLPLKSSPTVNQTEFTQLNVF